MTEKHYSYATVDIEAESVEEAMAIADEDKGANLFWSYDTQFDDCLGVEVEELPTDTTIYAVPGYDSGGGLNPADHWFWQSGNRWMAVVAEASTDWWEGADPADVNARPLLWRLPITEWPTTGSLIYRDASGNEVTKKIGD